MSSVLDLVAKITLDTTEYDKGLDGSKEKASGLGGAMQKGLGLAGKALAAGTVAVTAFGGASVKTGMAFDTAMSQVAATMGKTSEEMTNEVGSVDLAWGTFSGNLREYAQEMGANTAFSATQAAEALNYMALAGYDTEKSMNMLPNVLNLAAAGAMDLGSASDMVTDAQSALGLSMDQTTTMIDQMAKVSATTNTSVGQLGSAILTIGGTAKSMAGGTKELTQTLGLLADNGIKGAEGGTHLRNMILSLQTPSKKGAEALAQLGMSFEDMYDSEGKLRPLPEIFQEMSAKMEGMDEKSKDAIKNGLFNKTDLKAVNALLATTPQRWDDVATAIDNAKGSAEQMANTQLDNLEGDITLFKSALEGTQIALSDKLTPTFREFVETGTEGLSKVTTAFQNEGMSGAMTALGEWLSTAVTMILGKVPEIVSAAATMLMAFVQGLIDNLPQLAEGALQIILAFANALSENLPTLLPAAVEAILTIVTGLLENKDKLFEAVVALVEGVVQALPGILKVLLEYVPEIIMMLGEALINAGPALLDVGAQLIETLWNGIKEAFPEVFQAWDEFWNGINETLTSVWDSMKNAVDAALLFLSVLFHNAFTILTLPWRIIWENFKGVITNAWNQIKTTVTNTITTIKTVIDNKWNAIKETVSNVLNTIKSTVSGIWSSIKETISSIIGNIVSGVKEKFDNILENAKKVFESVKDAITGPIETAKSFIDDAIGTIKNLFANAGFEFPDIKLPHFSWEWVDIGGIVSIPSISIDWYRKAYEQPYMFTTPTVIGNKGFGDGFGGEMVYGHENLMNDIKEAVKSESKGTFAPVINIYTREGQSNKEIAEYVINEIDRRYNREGKEYA